MRQNSNLLKNIKLYLQIHWGRLLVASLLGIILSSCTTLIAGVLFQIPLQFYDSTVPSNLSAISITYIVLGILGMILSILPLVISIIYFIIRWKKEHRNPFAVNTNTSNGQEEEEETYLYSSSTSTDSSQTTPTSYYQSNSSSPITTLSDRQEEKKTVNSQKRQRESSLQLGMKLPNNNVSVAQETYETIRELEIEEKYRAISSLALIPMVSSMLLLVTTVLGFIIGIILFWVSFAMFFPGNQESIITSQQTIATVMALFSLLPLVLCCPLFACISLVPIDIRKSLFKTSS